MLNRYRVLASMATLPTFTLERLAQHSGVNVETIRTILRREPGLVESLGRESRSGPGGRRKRYRLHDDAVRAVINELEELERTGRAALNEATAAAPHSDAERNVLDKFLQTEHLLSLEYRNCSTTAARRQILSQARTGFEFAISSINDLSDVSGEFVFHANLCYALIGLRESEGTWNGDLSVAEVLAVRQRSFELRIRDAHLLDEQSIAESLTELLLESLDETRKKNTRARSRALTDRAQKETIAGVHSGTVSMVTSLVSENSVQELHGMRGARTSQHPARRSRNEDRKFSVALARQAARLSPSERETRADAIQAERMTYAVGGRASTIAAYTRDHRDDFAGLARRAEQIFKAAEATYQAQDWEGVAEYAELLTPWLTASGKWGELRELLDRAITVSVRLGWTDRAVTFLASRAHLYIMQEDWNGAASDCRHGLSLANEDVPKRALAECLVTLGKASALLKVTEDAAAFLSQALTLADDDLSVGVQAANVLYQYAIYYPSIDRRARTSMLNRAIKITYDRDPDSREATAVRSYSLAQLGRIAQEEENLGKAEQLLGASLELKRHLKDRRLICIGAIDLAGLRVIQSQFGEALKLANEARGIARNLGSRPLELQALDLLAMIHAKADMPHAALPLAFSLRSSLPTDDPVLLAKLLRGRGESEFDSGLYERAAHSFTEAAAIQRRHKDQDLRLTLRGLGDALSRLAEDEGGWDRARLAYEEALALSSESETQFRGLLMNSIGEANYRAERYAAAIEMFTAAADALRSSNHAALPRALRRLGNAWEWSADEGDHWIRARIAYEEALSLAGDDSELRAAVLHDLGNVYYAMDLYSEALEMFSQSVAIKRECGSSDLALTLRRLGNTQEWLAKDSEGWVQVRKTYEAALAVTPDADEELRAGLLYNIGSVHLRRREYAQAQDSLARAVILRRSSGSAELPITLRRLGNALVGLASDAEGWEIARQAYEEALSLTSENEPHQRALLLHDLGEVHYATQRYKEALALLAESAEIKRAQGSPDLTVTLRRLGNTIEQLAEDGKDWERALEVYEEALSLATGDQHLRAVLLHDIGDVQYAMGRYDAALAAFTEAAETKRAVGSPSLAVTLRRLGNALGRVANDATSWQRVRDAYQEALTLANDEDAQLRALILHDIGELHYSLENYKEALEAFAESAQLKREVSSPSLAATLRRLGNTLSRVANDSSGWERARDAYEQALDLARDLDARLHALVLHDLGELHYATERYHEAFEAFNEALTIKRRIGSADLAVTLRRVANTIEWLEGDEDAGQDSVREAYEEALTLSSDEETTGAVLEDLGRFHYLRGNFEQALAFLTSAKELAERTQSLDNVYAFVWLGLTQRALASLGSPDALSQARQVLTQALDRANGVDPLIEGILLDELTEIHLESAGPNDRSSIDLVRRINDAPTSVDALLRWDLLTPLAQMAESYAGDDEELEQILALYGRMLQRETSRDDAQQQSEIRRRMVALRSRLAPSDN